jgi:hypothetical protein
MLEMGEQQYMPMLTSPMHGNSLCFSNMLQTKYVDLTVGTPNRRRQGAEIYYTCQKDSPQQLVRLKKSDRTHGGVETPVKVIIIAFNTWILFGTPGCTQVPTHPLPYIVIAKGNDSNKSVLTKVQ